MVTTGEGKFYSTGVDVVTVQSPNPGQFLEVLTQLQRLLARLLTFPMVTVAAINGEEVVVHKLSATVLGGGRRSYM